MLIVTPIVGFCNCSVCCCALLFCNHLVGEERADCLLCLSFWCLLSPYLCFNPLICLDYYVLRDDDAS